MKNTVRVTGFEGRIMSRVDTLNGISKAHNETLEEFLNLVQEYEGSEVGRGINKLLDCDEMVVYSLFKVNRTNAYSMLGLFHSLYHAFADDGDYVVHRYVHEPGTRLKQRMNEFYKEHELLDMVDEEPEYSYCLRGDSSGERYSITVDHLVEIIEVAQEPYDYYKIHHQDIEGALRDTEHCNTYHKLVRKKQDVMKRIYQESEIKA